MKIRAAGLLSIILFSGAAFGNPSRTENASFECGYINCFDECTGGYLYLYGDTCNNQWDGIRQCWTAMAQCNSQPPSNCGTIACYDPCTSTTNIYNGNSCVNVWDNIRGCYTARGECR